MTLELEGEWGQPIWVDTRKPLRAAVTLYLLDDADRQQVARLVKAMCRLKGITVAIEIHHGSAELYKEGQ